MQFPVLSGICLSGQVSFILTKIPVIILSVVLEFGQYAVQRALAVRGFAPNQSPLQGPTEVRSYSPGLLQRLVWLACLSYGLSDRQATFGKTKYTFLKKEVGRPARLVQAT